jgi:hypothetical protein
MYIEAVHQMSDSGAVVTWAACGRSNEGFIAEWQSICLVMFEGDLISRVELYDEVDLDAALARFDELRRPVPQLENTASRSANRFLASFAARDWDGMADTLATDILTDDRRRLVGAGPRHGRDAAIADMRVIVDVGVEDISTSVIATRGEHLTLLRTRSMDRDHEAVNEVLGVTETVADDRIAAQISFDADDFDVAIAELDARYLAGDAADHPQIWSVLTRANDALNRRDVPATMSGYKLKDHRQLATIETGDLNEYVGAGWDLTPTASMYIETVHRMSDLGALVTWAAVGTSAEGFIAEWRSLSLVMVQGDLISRAELFDEADLGAALARFDELAAPKPQLQNAATRIGTHLADAYNRRDPDAYLALVSPDGLFIDRRKGLRSESEASLRQNLLAVLEVSPAGFEMTWEPLAARGSHLSLAREVWRDHGQANDPVAVELLTVMEVDDSGLLRVGVALDPDDIDAAFAELDARYRDGEAAAHAHTWSVVASAYVTLNRRQIPAATPDCVTVDRRGGGIAHEGNVDSYLNATWDVAPDVTMRIETVHRLTALGAVVTFTSRGTSQSGFGAHWRGINVLTVEGDLISRGEIFDEDYLDAALARFDELSRATAG